MDWPLQDTAHGKAAKCASSFSPEESDCGISISSFSSGAYDNFPSLRLRLNMRMRSVIMLWGRSAFDIEQSHRERRT